MKFNIFSSDSKRHSRSWWGDAINFFILAAMAAFTALPLLYVTTTAFKPMDEMFLFPPRFFVKRPTLDNFQSMITIIGQSWIPFGRYVFNTLFITLAGITGLIFISSFSAMIIEKRRFPGRKALSKLIVWALMFSPVVIQLPNYLIMSTIGITDTYWALILPAIATPIGLFLMQQFMSTIPDTLIEAAKIDGTNEIQTYFRIVFPLLRPACLTLGVLTFQSMWTTTGGILITSEALKPLNFALSQIILGGIARTGAASAVALVMLLPPLAFFIFSQRNIIETMAYSGIKE